MLILCCWGSVGATGEKVDRVMYIGNETVIKVSKYGASFIYTKGSDLPDMILPWAPKKRPVNREMALSSRLRERVGEPFFEINHRQYTIENTID